MEAIQTAPRMHPLVAGAAVSVILVSLLGVAAIAGILPSSHSNAAGSQSAAALAPATGAPVLVQTANGYQYMQPVASPAVAGYQVEPARTTIQKTVVHHVYRHHEASYALADRPQQYQAPVAQSQPAVAASPVSRLSPLGIAAGAVVGGLLGNQVGNGNGRTLATVADVVGGGYLGNTVGKNYGY